MIIDRVSNEPNIRYAYLNIFPDQFRTEKEKQDPDWIKNTLDYFANVAYAQYRKHRDTFVRNYPLMKGFIEWEDFYGREKQDNNALWSLTDALLEKTELPSYVKHYPIINYPVNTMVGELSKRPDIQRIRAFDSYSQSEEFEYKTNILQTYIMQEAKNDMINNLALQGQDISKLQDNQLEQMTYESVKDQISDYTSLAEMWGNNILSALKARFNMREKSEDCFRDLLIGGREFLELYEDNSKIGFGVANLNPKNQWDLGTPDVKYSSGASGEPNTPYAIGTVHVMEISEIIERCPMTTKEEIEHLRTNLQDFGLINVSESNIYSGKTGINSITYDPYDPLVLAERMMVESEMKENKDELRDWLGLTSNTASFGYKYTVVRSYWSSKKLIGKLTYLDEEGNTQVDLVDENYQEGSPNEISIEWGWVNQWYFGERIGPDIYHIKPFLLLDYAPIIGMKYEIKNTDAKSLVDLMKPFQIIYNICMNQLFRLLEKEVGKVFLTSIRSVPTLKDGDQQDALDIWEEEARKRGVVFVDDSPENTKSPSSFNQYRDIDLSRTQEIQSRYNLAVQIKNECWELVGINRQRAGETLATETATANENSLTQSFAQTEPFFVGHEYVLNQFNQALVDAAQYIESHKPVSTISYVTSMGESAFLNIPGSELPLRDLWVINVSRPEDQKLFNEYRSLAQPMLQNGATPYEVSVLYSTNSLRQMQKIFKDLKEKMEAQQQQEQQLKQQELDQQQQQFQAQQQQAAQEHQEEMETDNYNKEQDRLSHEKVALIMASAKGGSELIPADENALQSLNMQKEKLTKDYQIKLQQIENQQQQHSDKMNLEREKLSTEKQKMQNDKKIALLKHQDAKKKAATTKKK